MIKTEAVIRAATKKDIPFLAKIILLAETSGYELISYQNMFGLSEGELLKCFEVVLDNEERGHGLTYLSFLIAEVDGEYAGAAAGFVEGEAGGSSHLMTGALINGFGMGEVLGAFKKSEKFKDIQINKTYGTLQLDSVAVMESFRGLGLVRLIFDQHIKWAAEKGVTTIEIQVWAGNVSAISAYTKQGFEVVIVKNKKMENNLGGRILMSKNINK